MKATHSTRLPGRVTDSLSNLSEPTPPPKSGAGTLLARTAAHIAVQAASASHRLRQPKLASASGAARSAIFPPVGM